LCGKVKILARDVSDSAPMWRKAKGGNLITSAYYTAVERYFRVRFNVYNIYISRSDGAIFDESLIT
jgi:hypothetical protein